MPAAAAQFPSFNYTYQSSGGIKAPYSIAKQRNGIAVTRKNKLFILFCFDDAESSSLSLLHIQVPGECCSHQNHAHIILYTSYVYMFYPYINIVFDSINYSGSGLTTQIV